MTGETVDIERAKSEDRDAHKRTRSTIEFPYNDQNDSVTLAQAIHTNAGMECTLDQLAAYLNQSPAGGAFRMRVSAARIFGLIETERGGKARLTQLGQRVVDASQESAARVDSFFEVPLYKAIYEKFKGYTLPPRKALEREMVALGVSPKQADRARQVFERSAQQAGFFATASDRLVAPALKGRPETRPTGESIKKDLPAGGGSGGGGNDGLHPFIRGLLDTLPPPKTDWPSEKRAEWLQAAEHLFKLLYTGGDDGRVAVTFEGRDDGRSRNEGTDEARNETLRSSR